MSPTSQLRRGERLRLFLSYQRYCALVVCVAAASAGGALWLAHSASSAWRWPLIVAASLFAARCTRFAWTIGSRFPRKMRATRLAQRRIDAGRFSEKSIERYCEDPCFRVVAKEILSRTDLPAQKQKQIIKQYTAQAKEPAFVIFVDQGAAPAVRLEGALIETNKARP